MRNDPDLSVTTICSPCRAGDVAVTTTSAIGFFVDASATLPVNVPVPSCATAGDADRRLATTRTETALRSTFTATFTANAIATRFRPTLSFEKSKLTRKQEVSIPSSNGHVFLPGPVVFLHSGSQCFYGVPPRFLTGRWESTELSIYTTRILRCYITSSSILPDAHFPGELTLRGNPACMYAGAEASVRLRVPDVCFRFIEKTAPPKQRRRFGAFPGGLRRRNGC